MTSLSGGHSVGRYRIVRMLGQGAMGEVYLAEDPQIGRALAIKTLRLAGVSYDELGERRVRLLREAKTAGRLLHPHIVTLFDAGEEGGAIYLAFEYVPGSDLSVRLAAGPPPTLGEALRFVHEACLGLDHAHRQGIVHRDIKPSNLLLDSDGRIKISDFGIAKMADQTTDLTVTGSVLGSPHYLSPEQIRGEDLDGRSDLFSLGVVLYQLLAGRRPFDAETLGTLVYQILHVEPPPVATLRPELPVRLQEVVRKLLAKDREERFAAAGAVAHELALVAAEAPAALLAEPAGGTAEPGASPTGSGRRPPAGETLSKAPTLASGARPAAAPSTSSATWPSGSAAFPSGTGSPSAGWGGTAPPPPPPPGTGRLGREQEPAAGSGMAGGALPSAGLPPALPAKKGLPVAAIVGVVVAVILAGAVGLYFVLRGPVQRLLGGAEAPASIASTAGDEEAADPSTEPGTAPLDERQAPEREPARTGPLDRRPNPPVLRPESESGRPADRRPAAADPGDRAGVQRPALGSSEPGPPPYPASSTTGSPGTVRSPEPPPPEDDELAVYVPDPAPSRPAPAAPPVDATLSGGMGLGFRVDPPDAFVLLDGRVVGRAHEFTAASKRLFELPGAGSYVITLRRADRKDYRVRFEADPGGPRVTAIVARLTPLAAADVALSDLELHQVREAIGLRVEPETAGVLVDGRAVGPAARFSGGVGRANSWLELAPGRHRVSIVAPGHRQVDLAVEVSQGAEERRKRIRVVLPREGGG